MRRSTFFKENYFRLIEFLKNHRSNIWLIGLFAFSIPFSTQFNVLALILLSISFLLTNDFSDFYENIKKKKIFLLPIIFYTLCIVSGVYLDDTTNVLRQIELKSTFLIIPLIVATTKIDEKEIIRIVLLFCVACSLVIFGAYINNLTEYLNTGELYTINKNGDRVFLFYYYSLVKFFNLHPTYFSLYLSISVFYLSIYLKRNWVSTSICVKIFLIITVMIFLIFNLQLSSRGGLIALGLTFCIVAIRDLIISFSYKKLLLYILVTLFSAFTLTRLEYTRTRFSVMTDVLISGYKSTEKHSANSRLIIWESTLEVIRKAPILGNGINAGDNLLRKEYEKNNFNKGINLDYNSHSQWLQLLIDYGVVGLILFVFLLLAPLFFIKSINLEYYMIFIVLVFTNFTFENMLERQKGVVFTIFFYCINLVYIYNTRKK